MGYPTSPEKAAVGEIESGITPTWQSFQNSKKLELKYGNKNMLWKEGMQIGVFAKVGHFKIN